MSTNWRDEICKKNRTALEFKFLIFRRPRYLFLVKKCRSSGNHSLPSICIIPKVYAWYIVAFRSASQMFIFERHSISGIYLFSKSRSQCPDAHDL